MRMVKLFHGRLTASSWPTVKPCFHEFVCAVPMAVSLTLSPLSGISCFRFSILFSVPCPVAADRAGVSKCIAACHGWWVSSLANDCKSQLTSCPTRQSTSWWSTPNSCLRWVLLGTTLFYPVCVKFLELQYLWDLLNQQIKDLETVHSSIPCALFP